MKYSEYKSKAGTKNKAVFFTVLACCLLSLGGASWFAASRISKREIGENSSSISDENSLTQSQESIDLPEISSEEAGNSVSDQPYTSSSQDAESDGASAVTVYTMPVQGEILKGFSDTELQYSETYKDMRIHTGTDIACEKGTAVSACADGRVIDVSESTTDGTTVKIDHGNGVITSYSALEGVKVKSGNSVSAGDIIGTVGEMPCECADKPHLHLEAVKDGETADPIKILGFK